MITYEGPLYGKLGRRYIKLTLTSADVDAMERRIMDAEADMREAVARAVKAEARTRALLGVELYGQPWTKPNTVRVSIQCDLKSLCYRPEEFCKVIAEDLVKQIKSQANHF